MCNDAILKPVVFTQRYHAMKRATQAVGLYEFRPTFPVMLLVVRVVNADKIGNESP